MFRAMRRYDERIGRNQFSRDDIPAEQQDNYERYLNGELHQEVDENNCEHGYGKLRSLVCGESTMLPSGWAASVDLANSAKLAEKNARTRYRSRPPTPKRSRRAVLVPRAAGIRWEVADCSPTSQRSYPSCRQQTRYSPRPSFTSPRRRCRTSEASMSSSSTTSSSSEFNELAERVHALEHAYYHPRKRPRSPLRSRSPLRRRRGENNVSLRMNWQ